MKVKQVLADFLFYTDFWNIVRYRLGEPPEYIMTAISQVIIDANQFVNNLEIGYAEPREFYNMFLAVVKKHLIPIVYRGMFMIHSRKIFDTESWKATTKNITEFDTGYQGFGAPANSSFRKDKQSSQSYVDNPLIFAQALKDMFQDEIAQYIAEVKKYCLEVY